MYFLTRQPLLPTRRKPRECLALTVLPPGPNKMTREIGSGNDLAIERQITNPVLPHNDSLQSYRMESLASSSQALQKPLGDHLDIPPLHGFGPHDHAQTNTPGQAHDHTVAKHDSLWKIAENSLGDKNGHASPGQVWNQVQNIIHANKSEHPELAKHPNSIHEGMKLHIPDNQGQNGKAGEQNSTPHDRSENHLPGHHDRRPHHHRQGHHGKSGDDHENTQQQHTNDGADQSNGKQTLEKQSTDQPHTLNENTTNSKSGRDSGQPGGDDHRLEHALQHLGHEVTEKLGHAIAHIAKGIAGEIDTIGNCAFGPRKTLDRLGFHLPPAVATEQGRMLEKSGLFKEVPRSEVQPGDYGYRHWNASVIRQHGGVDKGDAFFVTGVDKHGTLTGANDHHFTVPEDGGRYRHMKFLRPTPEFYERYGHNI